MQPWRYGCGHSETDGHIRTNAEHCTKEELFIGGSQPWVWTCYKQEHK